MKDQSSEKEEYVVTEQGKKNDLLQTVEIFESIVKSQPDDVDALLTLEQIYRMLDRRDDVLWVARSIAVAYRNLGQLTAAIEKNQEILEEFPGDPITEAALAALLSPPCCA